MGSIGASKESDVFKYERSANIKEWSAAEEARTAKISKEIVDKEFLGGYNEYYESNHLDDVATYLIEGQGVLKDNEVVISKYNLVYARNWDENDNRVKEGKAVTGSTYYHVSDDNGAIDETHQAYKTKADAIHAAELYVDQQRQLVEYYKKKRG